MLHGFNFHGKPLQACLGYHHFSTIDDSYTPRTIKCNQCEEQVKEQVNEQINKAPIHKPIINSKPTVNQTIIQPQTTISTINTSI